MADYVEVGSFCPNPRCPEYGNTASPSIINFGKSRQGRHRFRCACCGRTFNANRGPLFYRQRVMEKAILERLALLADGARISRVARAKGFKEDPILAWRREAGAPAEAVEAVLLKE